MKKNPEEALVRELLQRRMNRRQIFAIGAKLGIGAAAMSAALTACGQSAPATTSPTSAGAAAAPTSADAAAPTTAPAAAEPTAGSIFVETEGATAAWPKSSVADPGAAVELSVAHAWDAVFMERQKQFDAEFTKRHPNITIKAENSPFGEYLQKYTAQAAGNALPDIMYVQFAWAQQLIKGGLAIPVDDYIAKEKDFNKADFTPQSLVSYTNDGKLYAVPYDEGPGNLYYNKDLFDKAGIPYPDDTWDLAKLKEVAIKLTQGEGPNKIFGLGELPSPGDGLMAPTYLMPFGAQYLVEPQEAESKINSPEAVEAMQWWEELRTKGAVPSPADMQNVAWPAFQFGKIAMTQQGSWATPPIRANSKFNWDVAKWPKGPKAHTTYSAGSGYMITRDSKNAEAAWIYLNEYLSTAGQEYMWASTGRGSPSRLSAWPAYISSKFAPAGAKNIQDMMSEGIATHAIIDQPTGPLVTQAAGPIWDLVVAGQLDVKAALDQIQAAIEPIIVANKG